jgi:glycosyltransferase involved in cell wall biosynthesis
MRIAFFKPYPDFSTNPTLMCMVGALLQEGIEVDIFMPPTNMFIVPEYRNVRIYGFPIPVLSIRGCLYLGLRGTLRVIKNFLKYMVIIWKGRYDLLVCIDSGGLVAAYPFARFLNIPFVYASFEIFFHDELKDPKDILEKKGEIAASRKASKVIIQDNIRAELLEKENRLDRNKFVYMPVAPSGKMTVEKNDFARKRFSIPPDKTIVIHSGSFYKWTCAEELVEGVRDWPPNFVLLVHTKYKSGENDMFINKINTMRLSNIVVSTEPLAVEDYEKLLMSVDIGLVLYKKTNSKYEQKNIMNIGLSSGKFSYYMKHGLPTITFAGQHIYGELLKNYEFGIDIASMDDMADALKKINANRKHYSRQARQLFEEKLDFDVHWPVLRNYILSLRS